MQSYSLKDNQGNPLDIKLLNYLLKIKSTNGFFVEVGANDGITQSNTYLLEKEYNWKGLLIEPSYNTFLKCKQNRSSENIILNCALVSDNNIKNIKGDFDGSLMSSINGNRMYRESMNIKVSSYTLSTIVKNNEIKEIDFMSLDVEGYELEILKGIELNTDWSPKVFLIEIYVSDYNKIIDILSPYYDLIENFTNYNKIDNPGWDGTHNDYLFIKKSLNNN